MVYFSRAFLFICITFFPLWIKAQDPFAGAMQEILYLRSAGKIIEARDAFQELSQKIPTYIPARLEWAVCESFLGRFDVSVALYDEILSQNPQNEFAVVGKLRTLFWQGKWEQVKRDLVVALRLFPDQKELKELQDKVASFYQNEIQVTQHNIVQEESRLQRQQVTFKRQFSTHTSAILHYQQGTDSLKQFELGFAKTKANFGVYVGGQRIWRNQESAFGFQVGATAKIAQKWWIVLDYLKFSTKIASVRVRGIAFQRRFVAATAQMGLQDIEGEKRISVMLAKNFNKNDVTIQLTQELQKQNLLSYNLSWRYTLSSRFNLGIQFGQNTHAYMASFGFGVKG